MRKEIAEYTSWNTRNAGAISIKFKHRKHSIISCFDRILSTKKPIFPFFETEKSFQLSLNRLQLDSNPEPLTS